MRKVAKFLAVALVAALPLGGGGKAKAAQSCPDECRREINEVICTSEVITRDGVVVAIYRKYWSNGATNGVN